MDLIRECAHKPSGSKILILANDTYFWEKEIFEILDITNIKFSFHVSSKIFRFSGKSEIHLISGNSNENRLRGLRFQKIIANSGTDRKLFDIAITMIKQECGVE
jgi:hypothetical protein